MDIVERYKEMTRSVLLGDIVDTIIDYRGKTPKKLGGYWSITGYRALSAKNIENGKIKNLESIRYVDDALYKKWMKEEVHRGDILLTSEAPLGQPLLWDSDEKIVLSQRLFGIRAKKDIVDPNFLYAYISSPIYQAELEARATGSTVKGIRQAELMKTKLYLPDLEDQRNIGNFIRAIDEKIELNRRMNETLEQMGQALFRHYFIDNPEAEKWEDGTVSDLVTIYSGYAFKRTDFDPDGKYGLVTIKNVQDGNFLAECSDYLAEAPAKVPDYIHLKTGDVLLSLTGNVGRVCIAYGENLLLNQRVAKLAGTNNHQSFAYFMFRQNEFKDRLISMSRGTAQLNLSPVETKHIKIKLPPNDALDSFYENAEPLFKMITDNYQQVQTLSTLRDTLLPRLISGKIKV